MTFVPTTVLKFLFDSGVSRVLRDMTVITIVLIVNNVFVLFYSGVFSGKDRSAILARGGTFGVNLFRYVTVVPKMSHSVTAVIKNVTRGLAHGSTTRFSFFLTIPAVFTTANCGILGLFLSNNARVLIGGVPTLVVNGIITFIITLLTVGFFVDFIAGCNFGTFN